MSIESKEILDLYSIYQNLHEEAKTKTCPNNITVDAGKPCPSDKNNEDKNNTEKKKSGFNVSIPLPGFLRKYNVNLTGNEEGDKAGITVNNNDNTNNNGSSDAIVTSNNNKDKDKENNNTEDPKNKENNNTEDPKNNTNDNNSVNPKNNTNDNNSVNPKNNTNDNNKIDKEIKNNNGEVITPNTNGSSDKEEVKIDKGDYLGKDKGLLNKADWLKKSSNSPAAKSGAFSDDERWAQQLKHRQWQKDNNRGAFKVEKPKSDTYTTRIGAFLNNKKVGDKKGTGKHKITQWQDLESYNPKGELLSNESYDAFDIVSSYLIESNQVENMDEALYVMMEMDAQTIQTIVKNFENILEARRADKKGIKRGEKGNPDTDQAPSGQQAADTKTGYKARRVERREGDKRRKANKERRGWNYGGKEAAAGDLANAQRQPDADLGSQKQVTDTGAHKDKHGWRQRVSSPASGRKSESASSEREDKRYPPQNPKHTLHGKKTKKDKPQGRYKEVKENYAAVEAIRLLIEKQNNASKSEPSKDTVPNKPNTPDTKNQIVLPNTPDTKNQNNKNDSNPNKGDKSNTSKVETSSSPNKNQDRKTESPKNDGTIEAEINQIQTMPALPDKDVEKFLNPNQTGKGKKTKTNIGGRWYDTDLPAGSNELKLPKDIA